jgi:hypothetical protein
VCVCEHHWLTELRHIIWLILPPARLVDIAAEPIAGPSHLELHEVGRLRPDAGSQIAVRRLFAKRIVLVFLSA